MLDDQKLIRCQRYPIKLQNKEIEEASDLEVQLRLKVNRVVVENRIGISRLVFDSLRKIWTSLQFAK